MFFFLELLSGSSHRLLHHPHAKLSYEGERTSNLVSFFEILVDRFEHGLLLLSDRIHNFDLLAYGLEVKRLPDATWILSTWELLSFLIDRGFVPLVRLHRLLPGESLLLVFASQGDG